MWLLQHSRGQDITFEAMTIILTQEVACNIGNALKMLFLTTEMRKKLRQQWVCVSPDLNRRKSKLIMKYHYEGDNPDPDW